MKTLSALCWTAFWLWAKCYVGVMKPRANRFTGTARAGRGALLGTAVVLLTVLGHTASGTWSANDTMSLVLLWPLAVALSAVAADRRRSAVWLFLFAVCMQALFHILLSIASAHGPHTAQGWPSATMVVGHLGAAAVTALLLAQGDRLLHAWLNFWGMVARGGVTVTSVPRMHAHVRPAYMPPIVRDWVNCTAICRRGPPALCS